MIVHSGDNVQDWKDKPHCGFDDGRDEEGKGRQFLAGEEDDLSESEAEAEA